MKSETFSDRQIRVLQTIGLAIKEVRKNNKMTQSELSEKTGLSTKYIGEIEAGKRNLSILVVDKISEVYGCNFVDFVKRIPSEDLEGDH